MFLHYLTNNGLSIILKRSIIWRSAADFLHSLRFPTDLLCRNKRNKSNSYSRYICSVMFAIEAKAICSKAWLTPSLFFALVVKCFIVGFKARNACTAASSTSLYSSRSDLFPIKTNGNFSGISGEPCFKN